MPLATRMAALWSIPNRLDRERLDGDGDLRDAEQGELSPCSQGVMKKDPAMLGTRQLFWGAPGGMGSCEGNPWRGPHEGACADGGWDGTG
jgi:hypothetical protein